MPEPTPIKDILKMPDKAPIYLVRGKLIHLYERKSGKTNDKEWSFQNGTLKDATGEIKVTFAGCPEVTQNWRNLEITLEAKEGKKGWTGVYTRDEEDDKQQKRRIIWVTPTGILESVGDTKSSEPHKETSGKAEPPSSNQSSPAPTQSVDGKVAPKKIISKIASLFLEADSAARIVRAVIEDRDKGFMSHEEFTSIRSTLFIQSGYEKLFHGLGGLTAEQADLAAKRKEPTPPRTVEPPTPSDEPPDEEDSEVPF